MRARGWKWRGIPRSGLGSESEVKSALFRKVAKTNVECIGGSERHEWIFE